MTDKRLEAGTGLALDTDLLPTLPAHGVQAVVAGVVPHLPQEEVVEGHLGLWVHVLQVPPAEVQSCQPQLLQPSPEGLTLEVLPESLPGG